MDFEQRLDRAIQRGRQMKEESGREKAAARMTEAEMRNLHSAGRLEIVEHLDGCLKSVCDRFPGFQFNTIASDDGWGARITRDDVRVVRGQATTVYSRLEMLVRPFNNLHILELVGKGTVRNRELYNRTHFQQLDHLDVPALAEVADLWVIEFAERYAAD